MKKSDSLTSDYTAKLWSSKQYCTGTKTEWHKNQIDQWKRTESSKINPCNCAQLIYDQGGRKNNGEKTVSSSDARKTGQLHVKE